jgi:hypothetical protein
VGVPTPIISKTYESYDAERLEMSLDEGKYLIPDEYNAFVKL